MLRVGDVVSCNIMEDFTSSKNSVKMLCIILSINRSKTFNAYVFEASYYGLIKRTCFIENNLDPKYFKKIC